MRAGSRNRSGAACAISNGSSSDPGLLERYGVSTTKSSVRGLVRGGARELLFNRYTAPRCVKWLDTQPRNTALTRWMYWKVLIAYATRGYRNEPKRTPAPLITRPALAATSGAAS